MADQPKKPNEQPAAPPPAPKTIIDETRVDEFAIGQFKAMGHTNLLSEVTVRIYNEFKIRKDRLYPGRLSPEGFAFVDLLADILGGRFDPTKAPQGEAPKKEA